MSEITLRNSQLLVKLVPMGASVRSVQLLWPGCAGRQLALCLAEEADYGRQGCYAGATLGPTAGRISAGSIVIDQTPVDLACNEGDHQLHGGAHNVSGQIFTLDRISSQNDVSEAQLHVILPDGLDGWPGRRKIEVHYQVGPGAVLQISYNAVSDRTTYLDLSSHLYWNLDSCFEQSALDQTLQIAADRVLFNDSQHLPKQLVSVADTPFDFRQPRKISDQVKAYPNDAQLKNALGYNNAFILNDSRRFAAELTGAQSGICLRLETDQPALVFYSGGYLNDTIRLADHLRASASCALALEAQDWPDAFSLAKAPHCLLTPGTPYHRWIRYSLRRCR